MDSALILCRFLQFAAAMLLWGMACLRAGAFPEELLRASSVGAVRLGRLIAAANLLAALGWLGAEAALAGEGGMRDAVNPQVLAPLLTSSHFGRVWLFHLAFAVAVMVASLADRPKVLAVLGGLNLGSLALTGHAVLPGGWLGGLHQALSVVHLLAAGFWVGGLAVLVPMLLPSRLTEATAPVLRRFSAWGHVAVALVFATGLAKTVLILTARSGFDPSADYSALLLVKVAAVGLMLGLALVNRYRLVPRLARQDRNRALLALRRGTLAELALVAVVLALVSVLATLSPFAA